MKCARPKLCAGSLRHRVTVERRTLAALPGSAEPSYSYDTLFTTRAKIETRGSTPWQQVNTDDNITHVITIRHTSIPFDVRDRVRDASGQLYAIRSIEDINEYGRFIRLRCCLRGDDGQEANL